MSRNSVDHLRLSRIEEALTVRFHLYSEHYRATRTPIAPAEGASYACDCRRRAALTADAVDRIAMGTNKTGTRLLDRYLNENESDLRARVAKWFTTQAAALAYLDDERSRALTWAAHVILSEDGVN
jgi:hypothetical protein